MPDLDDLFAALTMVAVLVAICLLPGCSDSVPISAIERSRTLCSSHGGLSMVVDYSQGRFAYSLEVMCDDGVVITERRHFQ